MFPSEPATIGTLIDLAQHLQDGLADQRGDAWAQSVSTIEQTFVLAAATLASSLALPDEALTFPEQSEHPAMHEIRVLAEQEVETGLARELTAGIRSALGVIDKTKAQALPAAMAEADGSLNLLRLLQAYVDRSVPSGGSSQAI